MNMPSNKLILILIVIVLISISFILYIGSSTVPKFVMKVSDNDFDIIKIEYATIYDNVGTLKLFLQTNKENLIISASSKTNEMGGCGYQFEKTGSQIMQLCMGDPAHEFSVSPIDVEHTFEICANFPWSMLYERESSCKSITLSPYRG